MDPATGEVVGMLTDTRMHQAARARYLTLSPDGKRQAVVQTDGNLIDGTSTQVLQIKIEDLEYGTVRQLTSVSNAVAYDPTWSPDGSRIAYVATESGGDEIYVIGVDNGVAQRLTFNTWEWDKHPTWSPDSSQIVFFSNRDSGRRQLWIMNADGSNQRNLSANPYNDWDPVWVR
jgi:TolB protein